MDESKEYIKMCEKAEEIQSSYKMGIGDFLCDRQKNDNVWLITENTWCGVENWVRQTVEEKRGLPKNKYKLLQYNQVWLPRQDQLQKIPDWAGKTEWIIEELSQYHIGRRFKTMEQLWLSFIMRREYSKTWNGKDWEVINGT